MTFQCNILVVEDSPLLRFVTQMQLTQLGYASEAVASGEEAVERGLEDIALIFMDVGLPGIDGCQATVLIREREERESSRRVPIIALTAHSNEEQCILAGMDGFLQKPAELADLRAVLERWLPSGSGGCDRQVL